MTIVPSGKILVTGANGYLAAWVVRRFLEKGYSVRGTVRSKEKAVHLSKTFAHYKEKYETVVVEDITKEGAFDEAVIGIDGIAHTASPFHLKADDPEEIIRPAVDGTLSILKSALNVSSVRRIVVTSSTAAMISSHPERRVFTELDWNEQSVGEVQEQGKNANQGAKYRASKTLAERAAWEFYNANKARVSWDLVTMNPPFIFGPTIHDVLSPSALGTSAGDWYNFVVRPDSGGKSLEALATTGGGWVDVRDISLAHVLAIQTAEAGGERLLISAGEFVFQDFIDAANSLSPSPIPSHSDLPKGNPGAGKGFQSNIGYDASKASRILGPEFVYHSIEETTRDNLADFESKGW